MSKEAKIVSFIIVVLVAGFITLVAKSNPRSGTGTADANFLVREKSHIMGNKDAKVTIVEFGDYQCPACGYAHPILKQVFSIYSQNSNVRFVFRNFPLPQHQNAVIAAEAAEVAGNQNKFWEMYDMLYENQLAWSVSGNPLDIFGTYAQQMGLNVDTFKDEMQKHTMVDVINSDKADGETVGVNVTPTFYINGKKFTGFMTAEGFQSEIDANLK